MNFMAPFSEPGTVASMTRPVYPPGVLFDSSGCLGRAATPEFLFLRGGPAAGIGPVQRQQGLPIRELSTVGRQGPFCPQGLRPAVRRPVVRTAMSAFNGPFLCASLCPGLSGCRDCSHTATKIKVDAEHPARKPDPLPRAVVVILGKCPEESRSNAPFPAATAG